MSKDELVDQFIMRVNTLIETSPLAAKKMARYEIPPYNVRRHNQMMNVLKEFNLNSPTPEQALHAHVTYRENPKKPRRIKQ